MKVRYNMEVSLCYNIIQLLISLLILKVFTFPNKNKNKITVTYNMKSRVNV